MQIYNKIVPKHSQPNKKNINEASFLKSVTDFTVLLLQFPPFFSPSRAQLRFRLRHKDIIRNRNNQGVNIIYFPSI